MGCGIAKASSRSQSSYWSVIGQETTYWHIGNAIQQDQQSLQEGTEILNTSQCWQMRADTKDCPEQWQDFSRAIIMLEITKHWENHMDMEGLWFGVGFFSRRRDVVDSRGLYQEFSMSFFTLNLASLKGGKRGLSAAWRQQESHKWTFD